MKWLLSLSLLGAILVLVETPDGEAQLRAEIAAAADEQAALMDQLKHHQASPQETVRETNSLPELRRLALTSPHPEVA